MKNSSIILSGQLLSKLSKQLNLGHGSTWPGHIALKVNPRFIEDLLRKSHTKVIMVAGTNGKTTTARMIRTILEGNDHAVIHNESGANLLNGIASTLLLKASPTGTITADYAIFEVDENALPQALKKITPDFLLILNLFRDQLDRYGEVDTIAKKWEASLRQLTDKTHLILNGDDPRVAYLGMQERSNVSFFGLNETSNGQISEYSADSLFCPNCGEKLLYKSKSYSHLGDWHCPHCHLSRPSIDKVHVPLFPLSGMYNRYNTTAVVRLVTLLHISQENIKKRPLNHHSGLWKTRNYRN